MATTKHQFDSETNTLTLQVGDAPADFYSYISAVVLGGVTFYVKPHKHLVGSLNLLQGVQTPAEVQQLVELLRKLKQRTPILLVGEEKAVEIDPTKLRRAWLQALKEEDLMIASRYAEKLRATGAVEYLSR